MKKTASRARDEKLLAAVRDRPVLYDQTMHVFKDYGAKNAAWKEVGSEVVGSQDKQNGQYYIILYCILLYIIIYEYSTYTYYIISIYF